MSLSTYGGLKTSIANYLNRDDLTSFIPDFITLAESDIKADVRHWRMLQRATVTLDSEFTQLPSGFLQAKTLLLKTSPVSGIDIVTPEELKALKVKYGYGSGQPKFAAFADEIQVTPAPDSSSYTMEMLFYEAPPTFSGDEESTWVLQYFPGLYLYGALKNAAPFLHEDERVQTWEGLYQQTLLKAKRDDNSHKLSGPLGSGPQVVF